MKVCFMTPSLSGPHPAYLQAMRDTIPAIKAAGWDECYVQEIGCPYISHARATMTRKALDTDADVLVYLDSDMSWTPASMLAFLAVDEPVVSGLYRYKKPAEEYMGVLKTTGDHLPIVRADGLILAEWVPGGFLKLKREAVSRIAKAHPELLYGDPMRPHLDLFNHGAHQGVWYGEDYAFSRRWNGIGQIWVAPDLDIDHHSADAVYAGNFHRFMLRQPGGSEDPARLAA